MDYIYIDTSIFEANNFLEGKRINEIFKLSEEKHIQIVLPEITLVETKNRATKNIKDSVSKFKKNRSETRILRNISSIRSMFNYLDENQCLEDFFKNFDNRLKQSDVLVVDYPTLNIREVFDKYFNDEFPFSKGEKKHEFPDAFALLSVELWCKENKKRCHVFSNDKDLLNYKSEHLIIVKSYEKYLDDTLRKIESDKQRQSRLDKAFKLYEEKKLDIEKEVERWLDIQLNDDFTYISFSRLGIHDIEIQEYGCDLIDFQITNINDYEILMEATAEIFYDVIIEVDDENSGYYDGEDEIWNYSEVRKEIIDDDQIITVQLKIIIPVTNDDFLELEVDEINNGKDFKI